MLIEKPAISVCMPVYNGSKFLNAAFACLAAQTRRDFEVIVVDDGSSDSSHELAEQLLRSTGLRGRVIRTENRGPEQARDRGCAEAVAPFIAQYDCDDSWDATYLEAMAGVLERHSNVGLVYCDFDEHFVREACLVRKSHTTPWINRALAKQIEEDVHIFPHGVFFDLLLQGQVLFPPCTMFRRSLYDAVGGYAVLHPTQRISLDWCFGLRASRESCVAYLDKQLLNKSRHDGNVSGNILRTAADDVSVLETILRDHTLTASQRIHARSRAATRCLDVAYQEWSVNGDATIARQWLVRSFRHKWLRSSAILLLKTFVPGSLVRAVRQARSARTNTGM